MEALNGRAFIHFISRDDGFIFWRSRDNKTLFSRDNDIINSRS